MLEIQRAAKDLINLIELQSVCVKENPFSFSKAQKFIQYIKKLDLGKKDDVYKLSWELKCYLSQQPKLPSSYWEKSVINGDFPLYNGKELEILPDLIRLTIKNSKISTKYVEFPGYFFADHLSDGDGWEKDKQIVASNGYSFAAKNRNIGLVVKQPEYYDIRKTFSEVWEEKFIFDDFFVLPWEFVYTFFGIDTKIYHGQVNKFGDSWLGRHEAIIKDNSQARFHCGLWELNSGSRLYKQFNHFLASKGYKEI
ncbi:MAG: hypothetical protein ACKPE3_33935 [Sphaerospermopsis kisseleviana]